MYSMEFMTKKWKNSKKRNRKKIRKEIKRKIMKNMMNSSRFPIKRKRSQKRMKMIQKREEK
jgi:hypothetical protein